MLTVGDDRHCPLALESWRDPSDIIQVVAGLIKMHIHLSLGSENRALVVSGKTSNQEVCLVNTLGVRENAARFLTDVDLSTNCSAVSCGSVTPQTNSPPFRTLLELMSV